MSHSRLKQQVIFTAVALASLCTVNSALASPYNFADYGNAPAPYGAASSRTGDYQRLGTTYGSHDDGVSWSINGGLTFGHDAVTQGQTVKFKFDLYSHNIGGHVFDPVRAWLDTNKNGSWSNSEMILSARYNKATNAWYDWKGTPDSPGSNRHWLHGNSNDWIKTTFFSDVFISDATPVGDTWLRARATCDASLGGSDWWDNSSRSWKNAAGNINLMGPTGFLDQGETEDYKLTILAKTVRVPEPSGLMLLGLGLLGLAYRRTTRA